MASETVPQKVKESKKKPKITRPWQVILYNDDIHSFEEVIRQVQKATGYSLLEATRITLEAHFGGKALVYEGSFTRCNQIAGVLREIGLIVEILG